jgi:hypothetical protein
MRWMCVPWLPGMWMRRRSLVGRLWRMWRGLLYLLGRLQLVVLSLSALGMATPGQVTATV